MVTVEVGDADVADRPGRAAGQKHLTLGALSRVDQDGPAVPPQEVTVVVPVAGRSLTGRPEHDELACRHGCTLGRGARSGRTNVFLPWAEAGTPELRGCLPVGRRTIVDLRW